MFTFKIFSTNILRICGRPFTEKIGMCQIRCNNLHSSIITFSDDHKHGGTNGQEGTTERIRFLKKLCISPKSIVNYPHLLTVPPPNLEYNVKLMRGINLDEEAVLEMSTKPPKLVWKCYKVCQNDLKKEKEHRLHYLSRQLNVTQQVLCSKLVKYNFVLSLSMARMQNIISVLLDNRVEPEDILSDLWILRCKSETVSSRLKQVQLAEVEVVKPWMARCNKSIFEGFMNRSATKQKLLGELSVEEYISHRLGSSTEEIKEIINREPQLKRASVLKIKKILDFLISSGFTTQNIMCGLPRVANRRIETIHSRLQELNQMGISPSLYIACKSNREYQDYISKRKKRKCA